MRQLFKVSLLALVASCNYHSSQAKSPPGALAVTDIAAPPPTDRAEAPAARSPEALTALLADYDQAVASGAAPASLARMREAIDVTAGQRDAVASRLFWYTDLEAAKAAAEKSGRPILSLRLLGRLDEELSCANSRLFRVVLYANPRVSQFLRDTYVLAWSSERPVPRMTLDYGDGRIVTRTLTGNSVHYVLDARGRIVDALPGLYGPAAFERGLRESLDLARKSGTLGDEESAKAVAKYHARAGWVLTSAWRKDLARAYGDGYATYIDAATLPRPVKGFWPDPLYGSIPASAVNALTESKADMEAPSLALLQPEIHVSADWGDWTKIADHVAQERIAAESVALLREERPRDWGKTSASQLDADQLAKRVSQFEKRMTEEELKNEYVLHGYVHAHLARGSRVDLASTNDFIYTRVFMTPRSDAWLGLTPTATFTGIDDDGLVASAPSDRSP
jgi:hypothetical protein